MDQRFFSAKLAWALCLVTIAVGCAHVKAVNSPEALLQYRLESLTPGRTFRVETLDNSTLTGILANVEWPWMTLLSGERTLVIDTRLITGVWVSYSSKRKGQITGAAVLAVPFALLGYNAVKHPLCWFQTCEGSSDPNDLARGAIGGAVVGALLGAMIGTFVSEGSPGWRQVHP